MVFHVEHTTRAGPNVHGLNTFATSLRKCLTFAKALRIAWVLYFYGFKLNLMPNLIIPQELQHLPKDKRGFPIPFNVLIDSEGNPHFKINDTTKAVLCVDKRLCHICGQPLRKEFWFIGGQLSAFHPMGAFADGPVHKLCGEFALKVCPYLAHTKYGTIATVEDVMRVAAKIKDKTDVKGLFNPTQTLERVTFFVFAKAKDFTYTKDLKLYFRPVKPYVEVEYWLDGERIGKAKAVQLMKDKKEKSYLPRTQ